MDEKPRRLSQGEVEERVISSWIGEGVSPGIDTVALRVQSRNSDIEKELRTYDRRENTQVLRVIRTE